MYILCLTAVYTSLHLLEHGLTSHCLESDSCCNFMQLLHTLQALEPQPLLLSQLSLRRLLRKLLHLRRVDEVPTGST